MLSQPCVAVKSVDHVRPLMHECIIVCETEWQLEPSYFVSFTLDMSMHKAIQQVHLAVLLMAKPTQATWQVIK